jgi:hypothetical protein
MKTDTELLDWLDKMKHLGFGLINDDNGHWAVSGSGMQNCPMGDEPEDIQTTFFVEAGKWKNSVREAIQAAIDEDEDEADSAAQNSSEVGK